MRFYIGLHQPAHARHFDRCMVSVRRLRERKSDFPAGEWMLDSGAFSELAAHGAYRDAPAVYAEQIGRWARVGRLMCAVTQDYMCEPAMLRRTGLTVADHQRLTVERYDAIRSLVPPRVHLMPVLQGQTPHDYRRHVGEYGRRLRPGMWVGVGSVCKRQGDPARIVAVLDAIHRERPDLRLHGFGVKVLALAEPGVREQLWSADSMAWSFAARVEGRGPQANDWREARRYVDRVERLLAGRSA
jgi:hypothetical protein